MALQLQMIGTGGAFAKNYFNNNALIRSDRYTLMIDCGITAPAALHQMKFDLSWLDGIFISHLHADHVGGLEELVFRLKYQYGKKITLYVAEDLVQPIWEHSLQAGLKHSSDGECCLADWFDVVPLQPGIPYTIHEGLTIELGRTRHIPNMLSYSILFNDKIYYSSDSMFDREEILRLDKRGCTHLFYDCQLEGNGNVHCTLKQLLTLPESVQSKIWLMHYGDDMEAYIGKTGRMKFVEQHKKYELQ